MKLKIDENSLMSEWPLGVQSLQKYSEIGLSVDDAMMRPWRRIRSVDQFVFAVQFPIHAPSVQLVQRHEHTHRQHHDHHHIFRRQILHFERAHFIKQRAFTLLAVVIVVIMVIRESGIVSSRFAPFTMIIVAVLSFAGTLIMGQRSAS